MSSNPPVRAIGPSTPQRTFQEPSMSSIVKCKCFRLKCCNRLKEIKVNGEIGRIFFVALKPQASHRVLVHLFTFVVCVLLREWFPPSWNIEFSPTGNIFFFTPSSQRSCFRTDADLVPTLNPKTETLKRLISDVNIWDNTSCKGNKTLSFAKVWCVLRDRCFQQIFFVCFKQ